MAAAEIPLTDAMVAAGAKVLLDSYSTEYDADHLTWKDFADEARKVLGAALAVAESTCGATTDGTAYLGSPGLLVCIKRPGHKSSHTSDEGAAWG